MNRWSTLLVSLGLGFSLLGCGETEPKRGSLMLAVSTDMYINKDLGRVDIIVQPENGPTQSTEVNLFPELDGKFLPGTFAVIEGDTPGEFVRIRVIARKGNSVRVVREAATRIPRERSAMLPMPIQWLCDGKVKEEGQLHRSDCDDGYTCVGGVCRSANVDETTLEDYQPERVFGGGNATGGGACFDTFECFPDPALAEVDLETCQVAAPDGATTTTNVAVVLPPGSDGHCRAGEGEGCLIPLDYSEFSGWYPADDGNSTRLQLPAGVCERIEQGQALGVSVSDRCQSKQPSMPSCGPWTLVGTLPGEDPDPVAVIDPNPTGGSEFAGDPEPALSSIDGAVAQLADTAGKACAALVGMSLPEALTPEEAVDLCDRAKDALLTQLPVQWHYMPSRCWVGAESQLDCERECDASCDPGTVETRCEFNSLVGQCPGLCEGRLCLGGDSQPVECQGYCAGECDGQCEGNCFGECQQGCSQRTPDGFCDGYCAETCKGLCEGRCAGKCAGHCDVDPTLAPSHCAGDCAGGCDTALESARCEGPLGFSPCNVEPLCQYACRARGFADMQCERATTWVMPQDMLSEATRAALEEQLPSLIPLYEIRIPALQQVTTELSLSLEFDPTHADELTKSQEYLQSLDSLWNGLERLLRSVGDSRGAGSLAGQIPSPDPGPGDPVDCTPIVASGGEPLIDDFEDGNEWLPVSDGRDGAWYSFNDGSGEQHPQGALNPEADATGTESLALHTWGTGFSAWGAGVGVDLRQGGAPYDASRYSGLRFRARGDTSLWVVLRQSDIMNDGHPCGGCDPGSMACDWYHRVEVFLSSEWTEFDLPWNSFENEFGPMTPVNTTTLTGMEFEVPAAATFDVWIDDLEFY